MKKARALITHSFRESYHSRIVFFLFLFIILMVLCSVFIRAVDADDRVKVIQSVSFIILGFFGTFISLLLPVTSLHEEMETRKVYNVLTKPVSRFVFLAGKLSGMMLFIFAFLALMAVIAYVFVLLSCPADARAALLRADRFLDPVRSVRIRADSTETALKKKHVLSHTSEYASVRWVFETVKARVSTDNGYFRASLDIASRGVGIVQNIDFARVFVRAVNPESGDFYPVAAAADPERRSGLFTLIPRDETVDVYIPEKAAAADGSLFVDVLRPGSKYVLYPGPASVRLYRPSGTYTMNFVKSFLFLFVKCVYIASVAMCGAAFFSIVSGITFGIFIMVTSYIIQFIKTYAAPEEGSMYNTLFFLFRFLAPDIADYSRAEELISGVYITWRSLFTAAGVAVCIYSLAYLSIAYFGLKDREF